jgi:hypothetical protein
MAGGRRRPVRRAGVGRRGLAVAAPARGQPAPQGRLDRYRISRGGHLLYIDSGDGLSVVRIKDGMLLGCYS